MQHPRFALRAVRKRGKSITGLGLRRDMLGRFFCRFKPSGGRDFSRPCPLVALALDIAGRARIERGCGCCAQHVARLETPS